MGLLAAIMNTLNRVDAERATPEMVVTPTVRSEISKEEQAGGSWHGDDGQSNRD